MELRRVALLILGEFDRSLEFAEAGRSTSSNELKKYIPPTNAADTTQQHTRILKNKQNTTQQNPELSEVE